MTMQHLQSSAWRIWRSHLVIAQNFNQNNLRVLFIHEVLFPFLQFPQILYLTSEKSESLVETCQSADVAYVPRALNSTGGNEKVGWTSSAFLSFVRRTVWKPWSEQTGFITSEQWLYRNTVSRPPLLSRLSQTLDFRFFDLPTVTSLVLSSRQYRAKFQNYNKKKVPCHSKQ